MNPLDRLRIEKAATDCGFEMSPIACDDGLELRSARFPESVRVRLAGTAAFTIDAPSMLLQVGNEGVGTVTVRGFGALYDVLRSAAAHARTLPNRVADAFRRETEGWPRSTEAERVVIQRVGQNLFRAALLDYWQGRCCVTGLDLPELLRASHIKPWAACDNDDERLDVFNGLLLAPHIDALFDAGLMTVEDDGTVQVSSHVRLEARGCLALTQPMRVGRLRAEHLRYFDFHRRVVWRA